MVNAVLNDFFPVEFCCMLLSYYAFPHLWDVSFFYYAERIYAGYSVYKGKTAFSAEPVPPEFIKVDVWT